MARPQLERFTALAGGKSLKTQGKQAGGAVDVADDAAFVSSARLFGVLVGFVRVSRGFKADKQTSLLKRATSRRGKKYK